MALNQALASKPINRLTPEAARAQVAEHRAEAGAEFYRHPKFAHIARRQKWIDQSQSLNLFLPQADLKTLSHRYRAAWRAGLKTIHLPRTLNSSNVEKATISVKKDVRITSDEAPKPTPAAKNASPASNLFRPIPMKRDPEVIRFVLLDFEGETDVSENIKTYTPDILQEHVRLLLEQDYIEANHRIVKNLKGTDRLLLLEQPRLTWAGHDLLDSMRDPKVWKIAKEKILAPGVSFTMGLLKEVLKEAAKDGLRGMGFPLN